MSSPLPAASPEQVPLDTSGLGNVTGLHGSPMGDVSSLNGTFNNVNNTNLNGTNFLNDTNINASSLSAAGNNIIGTSPNQMGVPSTDGLLLQPTPENSPPTGSPMRADGAYGQAYGGPIHCPSLYGVPSYSSIFADPVDFEPGPGQYEVNASAQLGDHQFLSNYQSAPHRSITSKHASSWARVYISKDHAIKARDTPGPGIYSPEVPGGEMGRAGVTVRFGTSVRKKVSHETPSPGPIYDCRRTTGKDNDFGSVKFTKDGRFKEKRSSGVPLGPGQYNFKQSFDGQQGLRKSFSVSHRAYDSVRFPGSERANLGRASPGPGPYKEWKPTMRGDFSIPRSRRQDLNELGGVPASGEIGPGAYDIDGPSAKRKEMSMTGGFGGKNKHHSSTGTIVPRSCPASPLRKTTTAFHFGKPSTRARFSWGSQAAQTRAWTRLGMAQVIRQDTQ